MHLPRGMGAITYDWTRCPPDLPPPQGPGYYGPLASDVGPRSEGEYEPAPDVELESCPDSSLAQGGGILLLGGLMLLGWVLGKK
jgi:hypothetical protein